MPSTTPERAARWTDETAEAYLEEQGYTLTGDWQWTHPTKTVATASWKEADAIMYLIEEWDYGGLI